MIRIQTEDFHLQTEYEQLLEVARTGAVVTFVGRVRDFSHHSHGDFFLEHYPGMTEAVLEDIEARAHKRWDLLKTCIIHRIGKLQVDDQIVFVGVSSAHREDAFAACHYLIDILKTEAPFWKKEGQLWVDANKADQSRAESWLKK